MRGTLYWVCVSFFLMFSVLKQLSQLVIGEMGVIYDIKALSVVIRRTFIVEKNFFSLSRKTGLKLLTFRLNSKE